jgi:predicted amidophosphoribosyltransferase
MAGVKIDPLKLPGPWAQGYVLERQHTVSSTFLGTDSSGIDHFDTKRSELGELVFRLKNRNDREVLTAIAEAAEGFITGWNPPVDLVVPVPPSRKRRLFQPAVEIARAIGARLSKPAVADAVKKVKHTPELKNVFDYQQRLKLLEDAFEVDASAVQGKRILLVDDLYRSGATAAVVAQQLQRAGAAAVYMLAITKTRTKA